MSSNTNNLRDIILSGDFRYPDGEPNFKEVDEAIAAVLALLPAWGDMPDALTAEQMEGFRLAIDQTRRNLIGEQHGDSE